MARACYCVRGGPVIPRVALRLDPATEVARSSGAGSNGRRPSPPLDEVGEPRASDVEVEVGEGQRAPIVASEVAIGGQALKIELDRGRREVAGSAVGAERANHCVKAMAPRVTTIRTRNQVNIAIRRIR